MMNEKKKEEIIEKAVEYLLETEAELTEKAKKVYQQFVEMHANDYIKNEYEGLTEDEYDELIEKTVEEYHEYDDSGDSEEDEDVENSEEKDEYDEESLEEALSDYFENCIRTKKDDMEENADFFCKENSHMNLDKNRVLDILQKMSERYEQECAEMFDNELKMWRKNARLTQDGMSKKMGIPKRTIEQWESAKRNPPEYVERLVLKELKEITEKTIEDRLKKEMAKMPSDENGNRPVGSWAIITTNGNDEFVELYETMKAAIDEFNGEGYIGYIPCNQTEHGKEAWYTDKNGNVHSDHDGIEL